MVWLEFLLAIAGLAGLYFGAEWLVFGSSRLALRLRISPLIIGLTIVAFGTSSPELLFCLNANADAQGDMVMGNIVGSNICNIALILGIAAVIRPLTIQKQIVIREIPILLIASVVLVLFLRDQRIDRWEAALLFTGLLLFLGFSARTSAKEIKASVLAEAGLPESIDRNITHGSVGKNVGLLLLGLTALMIGAKLLLDSAVVIAREFQISEAIIGLTLVAIGTSLPELATSIAASLRREGDLVTGNVVGSNIFNVLAILGITGVVSPIVYQQLAGVDLWFMLGLTFVLAPLLWTRRTLQRWEGILLLAAFGAYSFILYQRIQAGQLMP